MSIRTYRRLIFILVLSLFLQSCNQQETTELAGLPVLIQPRQALDENRAIGTWTAQNFQVTGDGRLHGEIQANLDSSVVSSLPALGQALFIQVYAVYSEDGDLTHGQVRELGDFIPVTASESAEQGIFFALEGSFPVPPDVLPGNEKYSLTGIQISFQYFQAYSAQDALVSIEGDFVLSDNDPQTLPIDQPPQNLSGEIFVPMATMPGAYTEWLADHFKVQPSEITTYPHPEETSEQEIPEVTPYP